MLTVMIIINYYHLFWIEQIFFRQHGNEIAQNAACDNEINMECARRRNGKKWSMMKLTYSCIG